MTTLALPTEYTDGKSTEQLLALEKLLQIRATRLHFAKDCHRSTNGNRMQFDSFPHIVELYNNPSPHIVLQGSVQCMKALPDDAMVHTPTGWRRNGDLKVGDAVTRPSGGEARITHVQPFKQKQMYAFTLSDGRQVESCEHHLWKARREDQPDWQVLSTQEIMADLDNHTFDLPTVSWLNVSAAWIESAKPSRIADATCIMLDDDEHLYITDNYVVTHNSEWLVVDHLAMAHEGLQVFFVVPKFEMRNTFVQNRVNRCVERVDEYKKIIGESFFDSLAIKSFGKGVIKYVGSNVLSDFKEFPADALIADEVDECDAENLHYGRDRLKHSMFQFYRFAGNPKFEGKGINELFQDSDSREWYVPCVTCGEYAETDWFNTVVESVKDTEGNVLHYRLRDTEWEVGIGRDIHMICPRCGGTLDRTSKAGRWIAANPMHPIVGYHIQMLCCPINPVARMWAEFSKAQHDPVRLQHFYNSSLGLPYSAEGSKITESLLSKCADTSMPFILEGTLAHIPNHKHAGPCVMGIDVGGNFDVHISSKEDNPKRRAACIGKVKGLDDLYDLVKRYNVQNCVIDSMPEANLARDFQIGCMSLGCDVWLCRYGSEGVDRSHKLNVIDRVITVDRTSALDRSFGQLRSKQNILPANFGAIQGFVGEMCLPIRQVTTDNRGNTKYEWKKGEDHARHADTYAMLADDLFGEATIEDVYVG